MVKACCAYKCKNKWSNENRLSFFKFPRNPRVLKHWKAATGIPNFEPTPYSRICNVHFADECFRKDTLYRLLLPTAIPTERINLPGFAKKEPFLPATDEEEDEEEDDQQESSNNLPLQQDEVIIAGDLSLTNDGDQTSETVKKESSTVPIRKKALLDRSLKENLTALQQELVTNLITNGEKGVYSEELKKFACTIYRYSPKAYVHVGKILRLPQPSIVQTWYHEWLPKDIGFTDEDFSSDLEDIDDI